MNAAEHGEELGKFVVDEINCHATLLGGPASRIMANRVINAMILAGLYQPPKLPSTVPEVEPMTDAEVRIFEREAIPFGKHEGTRVGCVDMNYLCRLADPSDFIKRVKRYLKNPRIKWLMEEQGDG
jgi:hypothetical protein